jgi:hypothetical protein
MGEPTGRQLHYSRLPDRTSRIDDGRAGLFWIQRHMTFHDVVFFCIALRRRLLLGDLYRYPIRLDMSVRQPHWVYALMVLHMRR